MTKEIKFNEEARLKMKIGSDTVANAVKITLGPKGRNVVIEKSYGSPAVTKDGVTVAKEITLKDPSENIGAQLIKDVASKTADIAGDGTTTATVLAQAMINNGLKNVTAGANPMDLKRGIDKAVKLVVESLKEQSIEVSDSDKKIEQVATVSANNDSSIGKMIAEAMTKVKKDGIITIEEAKGTQTTIKIVDGMQFNKGYVSPYFVTDQEKMEVVFDNPYILITDKSLTLMKEFIPILEKSVQTGRPLLIVCDDIDGEVLSTLVFNRIKSGLKVAAVKAPEFGDRRKEILDDMAILTGGNVISETRGYKLENVELQDLGMAEKIVIDADSTTIINGMGKKDDIDRRITQIRNYIEKAESDYDIKKAEERLAKLSGGVAVIYVGAASEVEMKERKDRFDDALHATKAAVEEGIIPGGGVAYIRAIEKIKDLKGDNDDETTGISIVTKSLEEPLKQIVNNSGDDGSVIVHNVRQGNGDYGYNARTEKFGNMFEEGVIDPTKVARVALENAASIASMLLTTECVIYEIKDEKNCSCNTNYGNPEY